MVELLMKDDTFEKQLSRKCEIEILDLFALRTAKMATWILLYKYQICTKKNWNKASPDTDPESNESNKTDLDTNEEDI